jgi:hypothetical protein
MGSSEPLPLPLTMMRAMMKREGRPPARCAGCAGGVGGAGGALDSSTWPRRIVTSTINSELDECLDGTVEKLEKNDPPSMWFLAARLRV